MFKLVPFERISRALVTKRNKFVLININFQKELVKENTKIVS